MDEKNLSLEALLSSTVTAQDLETTLCLIESARVLDTPIRAGLCTLGMSEELFGSLMLAFSGTFLARHLDTMHKSGFIKLL